MRITTETLIEGEMSDLFYEIYLDSFAPLRFHAAARHILDPEEWRDEMTNRDILKIIAWDGDDTPVGLSTLASDLTALPWLNAEFYFHRYPGRDFHYCAIALVRPDLQGTSIFSLMMNEAFGISALAGTVFAFDCSQFNVESLRMVDMLHTICEDFVPMSSEEVDRQHYWVLNFGEVRDGFELPSQRMPIAAVVGE